MTMEDKGYAPGFPIRDNSFKIRAIAPKDYDAVLEVYQQCEDFLALGPESKASLEMVRRDIDNARREGGLFCGIFTTERTMVGVLEFVPNDFDGDLHAAFLSLLMIAAPFRNEGNGTAILKLIEEAILKNPEITIILTAVQVNNPKALRFWKKNGYRIVSKPQLQPDKTITVRLRKDFRSETS